MRLVAIALIAGCSSMPDVNGNTLGESGHAQLEVSPDKQTVTALGAELVVTNTGDRASGAIGARLVDGDADNFRISHSDCSVLQPGGTCTVTVELTSIMQSSTTLEIDEDNEPKTKADIDGRIQPAIKWMESSVQMSAQDCTAAGADEPITRTIQLRYLQVPIDTVTIKSSDPHYTVTNNTCSTSPLTTGTCSVDVVVPRGAKGTAPPLPMTLLATVSGLSDSSTVGYALAPCDLVLTPDPVVLDAGNSSKQVTLTNQSTINKHILGAGSVTAGGNLSLPENDCTPGRVLDPGDTCTARILYTPSANPPADKGSFTYSIVTADASPQEPLKVTGTVSIQLVDNHFHFEQMKYDWGNVPLGSPPLSETFKVILDSGVAMAGPLVITFTSNAWVVEGGNVGTCGAQFTSACQFMGNFTATQTAGPYTGLVIAKDASGGVAYAAVTAKVN